jgi:hypothetical protein
MNSKNYYSVSFFRKLVAAIDLVSVQMVQFVMKMQTVSFLQVNVRPFSALKTKTNPSNFH